jgi:hypothetical protein
VTPRGALAGASRSALLALGCLSCAAPSSPASRTAPPTLARASAPSPSPSPPSAKAALPRPTCDYHVTSPPEPPYVVHVTARCTGDVRDFVVTDRELEPFVSRREPVRVATGIELAYEVDLDALADKMDEVDAARRFGRSLLAPASSFLLRPDPDQDEVPITVHFDSPAVESGLKRAGAAFVVESQELHVATYTTFGARDARDLSLGEATVRLVVLDGALDLPLAELAAWVTSAARGVADFYGRPPAPRTLVVLAPLPGLHGVPFGKMLPANAPGVIVLLGEHTRKRELFSDWVLVHELFHVGTPSYLGEGKWYDEGLATYFEPLIRARLGWRTEADVWHEFVRDMPRGLPALTERGLEHPTRYPDMYWGGGLFCLLADARMRRATNGARGLEDGVRAVFEAGGVASEVWALAHTTEVTDAALGAPVLAELQAAHREHGSPLDLDAFLRELGVSRGKKGKPVFEQDAGKAALRRSIVLGAAR